MQSKPTVYVVDDDQAVRDSLQWLIGSVGLGVETFASADEFLRRYDSHCAGCLLLDVRLPDMSGLELHEHLVEKGFDLPVIIITGHGDVPMAVRALKGGAVDFIEKPFSDQVLLDRLLRALEADSQNHARREQSREIAQRLARLTPRERQVLDLVAIGKTSRHIARDLSVATKTVEAHRAHIMEKMQATSVAHLVRMTVQATMSDDTIPEALPPGDAS